MSFILDALRKAEHDRQLGSPPSMARLTQAPATIRPATASLRPWLLLGLVLAMAVILVLALRLPVPVSLPPGATTAAPAASTAPPAAPVDAPPPPPAAPAETSQGVLPGAAKVPALDDDLQLDSLDDLVEPDMADATTEATPAPAPAPAAPRPRADPEPAGGDEPDEIPNTAPSRAGSGTQAGRLPDPLTVLKDDGPQLLRDMPVEFRSSFPAVQVDVHVHDPDPQRRWILVQGRRYAQGDTLAQGPRVEEITAKGTVLRWLDQSILVPLDR